VSGDVVVNTVKAANAVYNAVAEPALNLLGCLYTDGIFPNR
jgi:hypothetical protein